MIGSKQIGQVMDASPGEFRGGCFLLTHRVAMVMNEVLRMLREMHPQVKTDKPVSRNDEKPQKTSILGLNSEEKGPSTTLRHVIFFLMLDFA